MTPSYASIFMGKLETDLLERAPTKPIFWKRFIDDIFLSGQRARRALGSLWGLWICFITPLNSPLIGHLSMLTYKHQYLFHTSCHPNSCKKVSLFDRPSEYAAFVPQMLSLRNGLGSCVTTWFKGATTRTTWKGKPIGLVGFLGRTLWGISSRAKNNRISFVVTFRLALPNIREILHRLHLVLKSANQP